MNCETPRPGREPQRTVHPGSEGSTTGAARVRSAGPALVSPFFRGEHHFSQLAARARILAKGRQGLKVWCCACGTGEDAYSAAMTLREAGCGGEVVATDASAAAVAVGQRGIYALPAVERLGEERMQRHFFVRGAEAASPVALARGELRAMVRFARHDLRSPEWFTGACFDFIFCRDELSTSDRQTQLRILGRLAASLLPGGVLFLGETDPHGLDHPELAPCGRTAYERVVPGA